MRRLRSGSRSRRLNLNQELQMASRSDGLTVDLNDDENRDWLQRVHADRLQAFEQEIRKLTEPGGKPAQYPRPWHASRPKGQLIDPLNATVLIVGYNQATRYLVRDTLPHHRFIDGLFNRGPTCDELYEEARGSKRPSQTRQNIQKLVQALAKAGVEQVLETNVVCYSTHKADDLRRPEHQQGRKRGEALFRFVLTEI